MTRSLVTAVAVVFSAQWVYDTMPSRARAFSAQPDSSPSAPAAATAPIDPAEAARCKVPEFAKALGHEQMWKLHNNCQ